jgi:hypothetical protein
MASLDGGESEAAAPGVPPMKVSGIAEDKTEAGAIRSAVVSFAGEVWIVKAGDRLGRFRVLRVTAVGLELEDEASGETVALQMR